MKRKRIMTTSFKVSLGILITLVLFLGLQLWHPWQRQPIALYEPLILPIKVIKGDIIVLTNGGYITVEYNERINSIIHNGDYTTINATRHATLWELITWQ